MTQEQIEARKAQRQLEAQQQLANGEANMRDESETLDPATLTCEYLDETFFKNKGVIVNFINSNCPGATNLIGGFRLALGDVRKMPAYLAKNKNKIRAYAVKTLERHILTNLCSIGAGDTLCSDEYGISFTVASVTERVAQLNPSGRHEGALYYCCMPGLLKPVNVGDNEDGSPDEAHIINAYIHLLPAAQRRPQVLKRIAEEKVAMATLGNTLKASHPYRGGYEGNSKYAHPYVPRYYEDSKPRPARHYQDVAQVQLPAPHAPVVQPIFPPLPPTPAPVWVQNGLPVMPVDL